MKTGNKSIRLSAEQHEFMDRMVFQLDEYESISDIVQEFIDKGLNNYLFNMCGIGPRNNYENTEAHKAENHEAIISSLENCQEGTERREETEVGT